jgi:hypothetical protein
VVVGSAVHGWRQKIWNSNGTPMELQPFIVGTPQETPEDQYQDKERTFVYLLSFV